MVKAIRWLITLCRNSIVRIRAVDSWVLPGYSRPLVRDAFSLRMRNGALTNRVGKIRWIVSRRRWTRPGGTPAVWRSFPFTSWEAPGWADRQKVQQPGPTARLGRLAIFS